ncbi:MAG: hypothetical protein LBH70_02185 [Spirochaetaceae bacterium]|nr:hypothetical protein [Spirochaetaceae bacterium]
MGWGKGLDIVPEVSDQRPPLSCTHYTKDERNALQAMEGMDSLCAVSR